MVPPPQLYFSGFRVMRRRRVFGFKMGADMKVFPEPGDSYNEPPQGHCPRRLVHAGSTKAPTPNGPGKAKRPGEHPPPAARSSALYLPVAVVVFAVALAYLPLHAAGVAHRHHAGGYGARDHAARACCRANPDGRVWSCSCIRAMQGNCLTSGSESPGAYSSPGRICRYMSISLMQSLPPRLI